MIKYICDKGDIKLEFEGDITEICSDVDMLILEMYLRIFAKNPEEAEVFKHCIKKAMEDEICFPMSINDGFNRLEMLLLKAILGDWTENEEDAKYEKFSKRFSKFMKGEQDEEE
jgi:hypothetical protein